MIQNISAFLAESAVFLKSPKPAVPKRPAGLLPPQMVGGGGAGHASSSPSISPAERVRPRSPDCTAAVKLSSFTVIKMPLKFQINFKYFLLESSFSNQICSAFVTQYLNISQIARIELK